MPSTPSVFLTWLFAVGLLAPVVVVFVGIVFALVTRTKG